MNAEVIANAFNEMSEHVEANTVDKGFRPQTVAQSREDLATFTANLHGEVSELWEAYRGGKLHEPCDKAEQMRAAGLLVLTCAEEELADIIIRALDTARALNVDIGKTTSSSSRATFMERSDVSAP